MNYLRNCKVPKRLTFRITTSLLLIAAINGAMLLPRAAAQRTSQSGLTEEQRILHVLNRLGFGARPGDVARVKALGIENYINQQLNPEKIDDTVAQEKVKDLETLRMTTAQLYEKYPQPGRLLRQLERRGELPSTLAAARENRVKNGAANPAPDVKSGDDEMQMKSPKDDAKQSQSDNPRDNQEYRRAIRRYYTENGLGQPQRITAELQASRILRAVYSERQLQEVMVDFWTNHFNVFVGKGADRWLLPSYDRDTIRPNAMGNFSELLLATAQSPAMLFYLDNFQSVSPNAQLGRGQRRRNQGGLFGGLMGGDRARQNRVMNGSGNTQAGDANPQMRPNAQRQRRGINENYARELMELHTLGVDGGYTQKDVQEIARCFTGWTIFAPRGGGAAAASLMGEAARREAGKFYFNARTHDDGEKTVLGHKIPAGGGMKDGLMVLQILANHPSTSKYLATKLTRYFVSDNPSPALVERVAAAFSRSKGDIRETLRAIFFSPEFSSPEAYRAKVKRPFELAISSIRTLGGETTGGPQLHQWIARMGEPLYGYQTPNGYSDAAESWVNTGGLLERMNFGLSLASNRIPGTRVDLNRFANGEKGGPLNKVEIMDRFLNLIIAGDISPKTRETLLKQLNEQAPLVVPALAPQARTNAMEGEMMDMRPRRQQVARAEANITDPVTKVVGLILGSPEFQRQ
ncbi:MAG TPA: DUF1800 domain-containing protein [Pyrinomonadaceae bacterium]|nr:DUF1800 domain-containing protein [Pyrinomonadaceae bacterium]